MGHPLIEPPFSAPLPAAGLSVDQQIRAAAALAAHPPFGSKSRMQVTAEIEAYIRDGSQVSCTTEQPNRIAQFRLPDEAAADIVTDRFAEALVAAAEERGYALAVERLRHDDAYRSWWTAGEHSPEQQYWRASARNHLADYLETVGPSGPDVTQAGADMPQRLAVFGETLTEEERAAWSANTDEAREASDA